MLPHSRFRGSRRSAYSGVPFPGLPGTGCHVHLSLWRTGGDRDGEENGTGDDEGEGTGTGPAGDGDEGTAAANAFFDPDGEGPYRLSDTGEAFVAGLLEHAPALLALTAPTVESYDRLARECGRRRTPAGSRTTTR